MKRALALLTIILAFFTQLFAEGKGKYVGGDISLLPAYESSKTYYLDANGHVVDDLITWLTNECGWNTFRVRLFVNPDNSKHDGVLQDLDYVKALGNRIKAAGANFMLDFHYSDTWADPVQQKLPSAWNDCTTTEQKAQRVYDYTKDCLQQLCEAGAKPDLVQVGNEISYGIVGIKVHPYTYAGDDWDGFCNVLSHGCQAVREICPEAKIIIHTERAAKVDDTKFYYNKLASLDYDVIGLSYYPIWHGTIATLKGTLDMLKNNFADKEVQIVETAYNYNWWPTSGVTYDTRSTWPCSVEGQYAFIKDLIAMLSECPQVAGLSYWCPEEAGCGDAANWSTYQGVVISNWLNRGLWAPEKSGSGHKPLTASEGMVQTLLKTFLSPDAVGVERIENNAATDTRRYTVTGRQAARNQHGIIIKGGKKYLSNK